MFHSGGQHNHRSGCDEDHAAEVVQLVDYIQQAQDASQDGVSAKHCSEQRPR